MALSLKAQTTEFLLYTTSGGKVKVEVLLENETLWLSQKRMAELFGVQRPAITKHLKNVYETGELNEESTCSILEHVGEKGQIYQTKYYNLDAVISVGYRVNSHQATQFRIWASQLIKEYIIKGFAMDDERLKNGRYFGKDYFQELLERVRSIRSSERRIYQKITDIFAECSIDYDPKSVKTQNFYAHVQDKFHYAITGKTASEIIYHKADSRKSFMGMSTFKNAPDGRVLKSDTVVGKNYLSENEIRRLERTVSAFFDYIENKIEQRKTLNMESFSASVNQFLAFNDYKILENYGSISRRQAEAKAFDEYDKFNKTQKIESDFDISIKPLLKGKKP